MPRFSMAWDFATMHVRNGASFLPSARVISACVCGRIRSTKNYSRGAPPPAPPGDFCLGKSHQNRLAPKAADPSLRVSPTPALAQLAGRYTTRLGLEHGTRDNSDAGYAAR